MTAFGRFLPFVKGEKFPDGCFQTNKTVEPDIAFHVVPTLHGA
jgi:hypothetical protein